MEANLGETSNLLADPSNTIGNRLQAVHDSKEEAVCDFHQHRETGGDDSNNVGVGLSDFWWHTSRQVGLGLSSLFLDLLDHLLVHLKTGKGLSVSTQVDQNLGVTTNLERIDFKVEILVLDETVDSVGKYAFEITLAWASAGICGHHTRYRGVCAQERAEFSRCFELGG